MRTIARIQVRESYYLGRLIEREEKVEKGEGWNDFIKTVAFVRSVEKEEERK